MDLRELDQAFTLMGGSEDIGVGLHCRTCDLGGAPVAYYVVLADIYDDRPDVVSVGTIAGLLQAGTDHLARHGEA